MTLETVIDISTELTTFMEGRKLFFNVFDGRVNTMFEHPTAIAFEIEREKVIEDFLVPFTVGAENEFGSQEKRVNSIKIRLKVAMLNMVRIAKSPRKSNILV